MHKNLNGKIAAIIAILVIFTYGIFGIPRGGIKESITRRIHLGLDLKGGTHVVLQVHTNEAIAASSDSMVAEVQQDLQTAAPNATVTRSQNANEPGVVEISGVDPNKMGDVHDALSNNKYGAYDLQSTPNGYRLVMKPGEIKAAREHALDVTIETIRSRIDVLGVAEPVIQKYGFGEDQILVELPGVDDLEQVRRIIQSTARLEIHEVVGGPYATQQEASAAATPDVEIVQGGNNGENQFWALKRVSIVQGPDFRDARPSKDEAGRDIVSFNLTTHAGDRFYSYTSANIGKPMAIVLDNKVKEVANIQGAIRDNGQIAGGFTKESAGELSLMLRTGSLPASITYLETHTVGASLGADSIRKGVTASIVGMLAVMIFMLIYYKGAGINADLALILNLVILLGFMGFTGSTLTLPGIAGVILTIGMGVDSNVLIFERIREELHAGKNASAAVQNGFAHAWITILDTHVTTIVSAAILFFVGTGPVRGFAITLIFGLLANLFTAVFVSRVIFDAILNRKERNAMTLSI
ncbi:MAG: protein translocase subunit SecD [Acidobacteria bacterium]|nr:protein translocase subunit SecD [Acidobacteriota bacterium]